MFSVLVDQHFLVAFQRVHRLRETEADKIGIMLMSRACFDPAGLISPFRRIAGKEWRGELVRIPGSLCTHPSFEKRAKEVGSLPYLI
jgi:predicted Zn-dependent protease